MNSQIRLYVPLSLLLSTAIYAMDTEKKDAAKPEQNDIQTAAKSLKAAGEGLNSIATEPTALITATQSTVIAPTPRVMTGSTKEQVAVSQVTVESKSLGFITGLKDAVWGASAVVAHQISTDTFNPKIPANTRRLSKGIEALAVEDVKYPQNNQINLRSLKDIFDNCRTKNIGIDDVAVLQLVRTYATKMRTAEENLLTSEAKIALQNADKKRTALVTNLIQTCTAAIEQAKSIDKELADEMDSIYKKHGETILLGTEVKRLTRMVNDHLPTDGYDSDTDSKYDRPFNARKLELDQPTAANHRLNKKVADNLETIKGLLEVADKKNLKAQE